MKDLQGKTALVTGGGSGMGRLLSLSLAQRGARVVIVDLHEEAAKDTAKACGEKSVPILHVFLLSALGIGFDAEPFADIYIFSFCNC
jgi:NAD(P)-dependent dehydrogenase (short-subunit alcohol dehydrogenase family)